jgi:hypothetical protein
MGSKETTWVSPKQTTPNMPNQSKEVPKNTKSSKKLLGELYEDHDYLASFLTDRGILFLSDFSSHPNKEVSDLVDEALKYLDTRTDFWRQQKPIYARKKEKKISLHTNPRPASAKTAKKPDSKAFVYRPITPQPVVLDERSPIQRVVDTTLLLINNCTHD